MILNENLSFAKGSDNCKIYRRSLADEFFVNNSNYLEKALFRPNSALRMKIISSTYQLGLRQNLHSGLDCERKFQFFKVAFDLKKICFHGC